MLWKHRLPYDWIKRKLPHLVCQNSLPSLPSVSLGWPWGNRSLKNSTHRHNLATSEVLGSWIANIIQYLYLHTSTHQKVNSIWTVGLWDGKIPKKLDTFSVRCNKNADLQQLLRQNWHVDDVGQAMDHCTSTLPNKPTPNKFSDIFVHLVLPFMFNAWISTGCTAVRYVPMFSIHT